MWFQFKKNTEIYLVDTEKTEFNICLDRYESHNSPYNSKGEKWTQKTDTGCP